jgi:SAM-dependent methyltransferase
MSHPSSQKFFEQKYREDSDPWYFASSPYELGRYDAVLAALSNRRYRRAFEPGCSIGVLTQRLALLCDRVDAIDISPTAVSLARQRCAKLSNVSIQCASLASSAPENFDLLVFCEIGYYFSHEELLTVLANCVSHLAPGGICLASHWLGVSPDHILSGDDVHEVAASIPDLYLEQSERNSHFRLDRWRKTVEASQ